MEIVETFALGIPQLACLLDSNDSFSMFRMFGRQITRILVHKMLEICEIGKALDALDHEDSTNEKEYRLRTIEHHPTWDTKQKELLDRLEEKLHKYRKTLAKDISFIDTNLAVKLLSLYFEFRNQNKPSPRDQQSVEQWIYDNEPVVNGLEDFISHVDDLVTGGSKMGGKKNSVEELIEDLAKQYPDLGPFVRQALP